MLTNEFVITVCSNFCAQIKSTSKSLLNFLSLYDVILGDTRGHFWWILMPIFEIRILISEKNEIVRASLSELSSVHWSWHIPFPEWKKFCFEEIFIEIDKKYPCCCCCCCCCCCDEKPLYDEEVSGSINCLQSKVFTK